MRQEFHFFCHWTQSVALVIVEVDALTLGGKFREFSLKQQETRGKNSFNFRRKPQRQKLMLTETGQKSEST